MSKVMGMRGGAGMPSRDPLVGNPSPHPDAWGLERWCAAGHTCGSVARGRWRMVYSPVKACSLRRRMAVQNTSRGESVIP
jgi:hypothetical protein